MTLKDIWYSDSYKKLREETEDKLCFICFGGSYAYGTNIESSDIDIRGVMLPTKEELIGLKSFKQKIDNESDTVFYEFNKFIKLCMNNNPNVIEMLGCREYIIFNEVGQQLIDNCKLFLSKRCINTFGGYAVSQLRRLENALCHDNYELEDKNKHIKQTMDVAMTKLKDKNYLFKENAIETFNEKDGLYLSLNINHARIDDVRATLNDILSIEHTYNKLNARNNKKDIPHLNKHIMHLFRLYLMCFDILEKHIVKTYRYDDRHFLLDVRNGKFLVDNKLTDDFYPYLNSLEERLDKDKQETTLPDNPNYKEIEKFVIDINTKVINNTVYYYKEPIITEVIY